MGGSTRTVGGLGVGVPSGGVTDRGRMSSGETEKTTDDGTTGMTETTIDDGTTEIGGGDPGQSLANAWSDVLALSA